MKKVLRCAWCLRPFACFVAGHPHCGKGHVWIPKRWQRRSLGTLLIACCTLLTVGCSESFVPTAPTLSAPVTITVRTIVYGQHEPIEDVIVRVNGIVQGHTDLFGELTIQAVSGRETTIAVSKDGWLSIVPSAAAMVNVSGELWTFYLEPSAQ